MLAGCAATCKGVSYMQKSKILIVEDDIHFRKGLEKQLSHRHVQLHCVDSVEEGLRQLKAFAPDLVLLDLGFPDVDGMAFFQHMDEYTHPESDNPRVFVISGHVDDEIVQYALELGAECYFKKPFDFIEFLKRIDEMLIENGNSVPVT
jgi:DNA-binding response OmpR family regulator